MKIIRKIITVFVSLAFSAGMFYCFQAGPLAEDGEAFWYTAASALFSLIVPAALIACWSYIRYLHEKLNETM